MATDISSVILGPPLEPEAATLLSAPACLRVCVCVCTRMTNPLVCSLAFGMAVSSVGSTPSLSSPPQRPCSGDALGKKKRRQRPIRA